MALAKILIRGGTSAQWAAANPVLDAREVAIDTTLKRVKVGDGQTAWSSLPWATMSGADIARIEAAAASANTAASGARTATSDANSAKGTALSAAATANAAAARAESAADGTGSGLTPEPGMPGYYMIGG